MARLTATWRHADRPAGQPSLDVALSPGGTVVDDVRTLTPAEIETATARLAGALRSQGVRRGDTVAWQAANRWEVVALYRASWRLGAVAAPLHHQAGPADVDRMVRRLDPALVVDPDRVAAMIERGEPVPPPGGGADAVDADSGSVPRNDLAVVLHTSGTSAEPKGVLHTHAGLAYKAWLMVGVHGLQPDDAVLMPAPLAHVSGLQNAVTVTGAAAMTTVLMARWDPEHALQLIQRHRITFMVGPPTFFVALRHAAGFSPDRVRSIRLISCGGAGVTPDFVRETSQAFGAVVKRTYGSTEAPTVTTSHAGDDPERASTTDGRPTGSVRLRLGGDGEVWVRGPELFVGYDDAARTAESTSGDWFRTGDLGRIDDGWLTIVGRVRDVVIRGGENIAAAEVEALLEAHPDVRQVCVVGEPDPRLGERVCAFVVAAGDASSATLDVDACRRWLAAQGAARFKAPERIVLVDRLPHLASGKVDRAALRRRVAEEAAWADTGRRI